VYLEKEGCDLLLHHEACRNASERPSPSTVFVSETPRATSNASGLTWP
jgi:hypothetical protein